MASMQVTVPDGVFGGQTIAVQTPSGQMQTTVPPGLKGGDQFMLQMPAPVMAQATAMPMPVDAVQGMPVADGGVVMAQPVTPIQPVMPVMAGYSGILPEAVRTGGWPKIPSHEAEAYCRSLPQEQADAKLFGGCRIIRAANGSGMPCGASYGINPCGRTPRLHPLTRARCPAPPLFSRPPGSDALSPLHLVGARVPAECLMFPFVCLFGIPCPPIVCSCERMDNQWITRGKHGEKTGAWVIIDAENKHLAAYGVKCCSQQLEDNPQCYCQKV